MIMQVLKLEIKIRDTLLLSKLLLLRSTKKIRVSTIRAVIRRMLIAISSNAQRIKHSEKTIF